MNAAEKFGDRVRALRTARKLKTGELAEKAGTGVKHLGRVERGEKQPSFELIIALAQALSVPPARLFDFDSEQSSARNSRRQLERILADLEPSKLRKIECLVRTFLEP